MNSLQRKLISVSVLLGSSCLQAEVVFDGSIGANPAGTAFSGNFTISEADGIVSGNNLFHSFQRFNVNQGEAATFTHSSPNIAHIVSRVTGGDPSAINGGILLRQDDGGTLNPTQAALWLINPAGVVIGDGAFLDPQGVFNISTANRIGFDNGDDFFSHDVSQNSTLSVAMPTAFGFLDKQALPTGFQQGHLQIKINDPGDANVPLFLSSARLVGTSNDSDAAVSVIGDIASNVELSNGIEPLSTRILALRLDIVGLGEGGAVTLAGDGMPAVTGNSSAVQISDSNILLTDNGQVTDTGFTISAKSLAIQHSYLLTQSILLSPEIRFSGTESITVADSFVGTFTTNDVMAGDIIIDAASYLQRNSVLQSISIATGGNTGAAGNLLFGTSGTVALDRFQLESGSLFSISNSFGTGGDIVVNAAGEVALGQSSSDTVIIRSVSSSSADVGNIGILGQTISANNTDIGVRGNAFSSQPGVIFIDAGDGGLFLDDTTVNGSQVAGLGANVFLRSQADITITATTGQLIGSSGIGAGVGGSVLLEAAGDVAIAGPIEISSVQLAGSAQSAAALPVSISAENIFLSGSAGSIATLAAAEHSGADILITARNRLVIEDGFSVETSANAEGRGGSLLLQSDTLMINGNENAPIALTSSTLSSVDAGRVVIDVSGAASLDFVEVNSVSVGGGAAGEIVIESADLSVNNSSFFTSTISDDASDSSGGINLRAQGTLRLNRSFLQSNTANAAPGGQIVLQSEGDLEIAQSRIQAGSLGSGLSGGLDFRAAGRLAIWGVDTEILTNSTGSTQAGDVLLSANSVHLFDRAIIQTSAQGSGDAGTIRVEGDSLLFSGGRVESTSKNAGGGDIELFGREIRLDDDLENGVIAFITTDSQSSDALGNGGSITLGDPANPADSILVRRSGLTASAAAGSGGRININANAFLRDALSVFRVTSQSGAAGSLEVNAPEQDISAAVKALNTQFLDTAGLLRSYCDRNTDERRSTLEIWELGGDSNTGGYQPSYSSLLLSSSAVNSSFPQTNKQLVSAMMFHADACGK
jgi:filamentous hemagglutinin family protein